MKEKPTIERKRELITAAYPHSKTWPYKVKGMSDKQVDAQFSRMLAAADEKYKTYKKKKYDKKGR